MTTQFLVEVAYATPEEQVILSVSVSEGTTALQAVEKSGIVNRFPEIDLSRVKLGIFGKLSKTDTVVREHDRVEIYRPLIADPKEVRRKRAEEGKAMKKGGGDLEAGE